MVHAPAGATTRQLWRTAGTSKACKRLHAYLLLPAAFSITRRGSSWPLPHPNSRGLLSLLMTARTTWAIGQILRPTQATTRRRGTSPSSEGSLTQAALTLVSQGARRIAAKTHKHHQRIPVPEWLLAHPCQQLSTLPSALTFRCMHRRQTGIGCVEWCTTLRTAPQQMASSSRGGSSPLIRRCMRRWPGG